MASNMLYAGDEPHSIPGTTVSSPKKLRAEIDKYGIREKALGYTVQPVLHNACSEQVM
ncbi:MAG: hypothetical protein QXN94_02190 [Thermofilaceae archaeon]